MPATTTSPAAEAFTQTVDKTAEAITATYDSFLGAWNAWAERNREVGSVLQQSFLANLESAVERNREAGREFQDYAQKVAGLQQEWFNDFSERVRDYQTEAVERYRTSIDEGLNAWTDITRRQFDTFAGQVNRLGDDFEKAGDRTRRENKAAAERTAAAARATADTLEESTNGNKKASKS
jgi:hypothetical protein